MQRITRCFFWLIVISIASIQSACSNEEPQENNQREMVEIYNFHLGAKNFYNHIQAIDTTATSKKQQMAIYVSADDINFNNGNYWGLDAVTYLNNVNDTSSTATTVELSKLYSCSDWAEIICDDESLTILLDANKTEFTRKIEIKIVSDYDDNGKYGCGTFIVYQRPAKSKSFTYNVRYKGEILSSLAYVDGEGDMKFEDRGFRNQLKTIETQPGVEMVLLEDGVIDYFDDEDFSANERLRSLVKQQREIGDIVPQHSIIESRFGDGALGKLKLYSGLDYVGAEEIHALTDVFDYYDVPTFEHTQFYRSISSLSLRYSGLNKDACAVLTVWDRINYNYGDNTRLCHRLTMIASMFFNNKSISDLSQIKMIGSDSTWDNKIESLSFHFGYCDSILPSY